MEITVAELLAQYKSGERHFVDLDIEPNGDFRGAHLEGAVFEKCFLSVDLRNSNLRKVSFINSNIKCCDFGEADLTGARIEACSVEGIRLKDAKTTGMIFRTNYCYSMVLEQGDLESFNN
jgi:uncharacterized protein YjbI with pentapeptide repeats